MKAGDYVQSASIFNDGEGHVCIAIENQDGAIIRFHGGEGMYNMGVQWLKGAVVSRFDAWPLENRLYVVFIPNSFVNPLVPLGINEVQWSFTDFKCDASAGI